MCISLKKKKYLYYSSDTLTPSVWVGLVLVGNALEALADDEEDHDEQKTMDHLCKDKKTFFLHFLRKSTELFFLQNKELKEKVHTLCKL